jgi:hypothetical protein
MVIFILIDAYVKRELFNETVYLPDTPECGLIVSKHIVQKMNSWMKL